MFFGRNKTKTWGLGGVAFLDLERHHGYKAYNRLYKINLQQFNDVLKQENNVKHLMNYPLFGLAELARIKYQRYRYVGALKKGWYSTVQYLGTVEDLLVLTFTCQPSKLSDFRTGKLPLCAPSKTYKDVIIKALVEEGKIPEEKAIAYVRLL
ncbi:Histone deacetylase [Handroanthus impetiginosus]|uniref:Histone deacetylase n=1 Tax=Handroanthus impetiginosus TaxID=429701 RepID=A0A2G9G6G9_9LAMI|nr:Histone deacetylase [Handroanthus impetiginosus]